MGCTYLDNKLIKLRYDLELDAISIRKGNNRYQISFAIKFCFHYIDCHPILINLMATFIDISAINKTAKITKTDVKHR